MTCSLLGELPAYIFSKKIDVALSHLTSNASHPDEVDDMITPGTERNRLMNDGLRSWIN
jgi:hypothetical protein